MAAPLPWTRVDGGLPFYRHLAVLRIPLVLAALVPGVSLALDAQSTAARRTTTIEAIHEFPTYFHLQNVLVRGEFAEQKGELVLRDDAVSLHLINPAQATGKLVEVRGQVFDVGKLDRSDGRLGAYSERFANAEWPRPSSRFCYRTSIAATQASLPG